jgi:phosphoribosylformylglycinamidine cyclo-ligase
MVVQEREATDRYREAGVNIAAGNRFVDLLKPIAATTRRPGVVSGLGGFAALFDPRAAGFEDPLLVATTDGVGTKLLLASETGRLEGLGIDLVAMCVNDLVAQGATPLFFLDYLASGRLDPEPGAILVRGMAEGCRQAGCALIGGETAEMPGLYAPGHFDLAGFAVGAVARQAVLPRDDIRPGDIVLGLASSGLHSNGFSLVRLILAESGRDLDAEAPFAPGQSLAAALLTPTRIYVQAALAALGTGAVKAMAHITGGGLLENIPRVLPSGCSAELDAGSWELPPVLRWLAAVGRLAPLELARTFNAGIGLVLIVEPGAVPEVGEALRAAGEAPRPIGVLKHGDRERVALDGMEIAWRGAA